MVPWQLMELHSTPYNAELSYTLCINFLHRHKMPRLDLQLADSHTDTHKVQMIMLIEARKVVILFQKMQVALDPSKSCLDRCEWSTVCNLPKLKKKRLQGEGMMCCCSRGDSCVRSYTCKNTTCFTCLTADIMQLWLQRVSWHSYSLFPLVRVFQQIILSLSVKENNYIVFSFLCYMYVLGKKKEVSLTLN